MPRLPFFLMPLALLAICLTPLTGRTEQPQQRPPNIVFIFIDDMGYGDLSCYGNDAIETANMDRLAEEGTKFTQFYVNSPICSPSRVAVTTGMYPARWRINSYIASREKNQRRDMADWLDPDAPTLARTLQRAGYATGHFGKWHMGGGRDVGDAPLPRAYGFGESLVSFEGLGDRLLDTGSGLADQSAQLGRGDIRRVAKREKTLIYTDHAIRFIEQHRDQPFYVQLWPNDVHDPFDPRPELMEKFDPAAHNKYVRQYLAVMENLDRSIGRLLDKLDELNLTRNTIVVLASDNGPTAWPHYYRRGYLPPGKTAGLRGRKWSLYEGGIREPLLVRWPGGVPAGAVNDETVVAGFDLFPTLCALAGVEPPEADLDGLDMNEAFLGGEPRREQPLMWEYGREDFYLRPHLHHDRSPNLAIREGRWKLLVNADGSDTQLYNLKADPAESHNLAPEHPELVQRLTERVRDWRKSLP